MKCSKDCDKIFGNFNIKNFSLEREQSYTIKELLIIVSHLRGENGCPWDRKQTHQSIRNNLLEEAYETVEAIDLDNKDMLCEELGDLLLQVVFHADIEKDKESFDFDSVCDGICRKLIERHPHIFCDESVEDQDEVLRNWEAIKRKTKGQTSVAESLDSIPEPLPGLMKTRKVQDRVIKAGMPNEIFGEYINSAKDYLLSLNIQNDKETKLSEDQFGEILFSVVALGKMSGVDSEEALQKATQRFVSKFSKFEDGLKKQGIKLSDKEELNLDQIIGLWKNE